VQYDAPPSPPPNLLYPLTDPSYPDYQHYLQVVIPIHPQTPTPPIQAPPPPPPMAAQVGPAIQQRGADPKWPKLPIFDSSYKSFSSWKNQFQLYINGHPHYFSSDTQKIVWMLSYISGSASAIAWADEKRRSAQELGQRNGTPPDYGTWVAFEQALNDRFLDPIAQQEASHQLFTAHQRHLPLDEFFNIFDLWVSLSGINEDWVLLDLMKDAVDPQIV
jgi:hypothetical protein